MRRGQHQHQSLLDEYCNQLGALLERRDTERVLIASKERAEAAARLAEQAMRHAQAADRGKSQFLATMTHELRTPLNAIIGFSEIIQTAPRSSGDVPVYAQYIREAGTQLLTMLNGVLDLARIEAGKLSLTDQEALLDEVIDAAIRPLRAAAEEKSIAIRRDAAVDCVLRIDLGKMTQVFSNLLSNAIKFTPSGGKVDIEASLGADGGLTVRVRDTGQGIPSEDLVRVLQPLDQVEDHLTRQHGGIGLGLPIARALVRMHGGELTLDSTVDVGTTVEILLPADRVRPHTTAAVA